MLKMENCTVFVKCVFLAFAFALVEAGSQRFGYKKNTAVHPAVKPLLKLWARSKVECAKLLLEKGGKSASFSKEGSCLLYDHIECHERLLGDLDTGYIFPGNVVHFAAHVFHMKTIVRTILDLQQVINE